MSHAPKVAPQSRLHPRRCSRPWAGAGCGREPAVVFPLVRVAVRPAEAPLVCLACCPTGAGFAAAPGEPGR